MNDITAEDKWILNHVAMDTGGKEEVYHRLLLGVHAMKENEEEYLLLSEKIKTMAQEQWVELQNQIPFQVHICEEDFECGF